MCVECDQVRSILMLLQKLLLLCGTENFPSITESFGVEEKNILISHSELLLTHRFGRNKKKKKQRKLERPSLPLCAHRMRPLSELKSKV